MSSSRIGLLVASTITGLFYNFIFIKMKGTKKLLKLNDIKILINVGPGKKELVLLASALVVLLLLSLIGNMSSVSK